MPDPAYPGPPKRGGRAGAGQVYLPNDGGKVRLLGIPAIRDRVGQGAFKLILLAICFREGRSPRTSTGRHLRETVRGPFVVLPAIVTLFGALPNPRSDGQYMASIRSSGVVARSVHDHEAALGLPGSLIHGRLRYPFRGRRSILRVRRPLSRRLRRT